MLVQCAPTEMDIDKYFIATFSRAFYFLHFFCGKHKKNVMADGDFNTEKVELMGENSWLLTRLKPFDQIVTEHINFVVFCRYFLLFVFDQEFKRVGEKVKKNLLGWECFIAA